MTLILEKFTSQNFQFTKKFSSLKVIDKIFMGDFFQKCNNIFACQMQKTA